LKYPADNYAWYAMTRWAEATVKFTPDPSMTSTTTAPDLDFPDLIDDDGSAARPIDFDTLDYDEISTDEEIAFAARDYTPNGWLTKQRI
jgi:hypothetical protein